MTSSRFSWVLDALKAEPKASWDRVLQRVGWREKANDPAASATPAQVVRAAAPSPSAAPRSEPPSAFGEPARFAHRLSPEAAATKPGAFWDVNYPDADRLDTEAQLATIWNHRQMWSLLAMLSGQFYPEVYKRLPAESIRCQMLNRGQPAALAWLEHGVESPHMAFGRMIYGYAPFGTPSWINYADRRVAIGASSAAYVRLDLKMVAVPLSREFRGATWMFSISIPRRHV